MNQIQIHINEDYYDLVPRPTKEERNALKFSILTQGQREPIVVNDSGEILDGHTRFEICQELKLKPFYRQQKFNSKLEEQTYVIECNVNRRQLNDFQKVELSRKLFDIIKKQRKENLQSTWLRYGLKNKKGSSRLLFAQAIGLKEKKTEAALKILDSGNHNIIQQCRSGILSINGGLALLNKEPRISSYHHPNIRTLISFFKDDPVISEQLKNILKKYSEAHK